MTDTTPCPDDIPEPPGGFYRVRNPRPGNVNESVPAALSQEGHDPKATAGSAKLPMDVLPWAVILEMAAAMGEGAIKYGRHNWRKSGAVRTSTYVSACFRHLIAIALGEDIDPDTVAADGSGGVSHLTKLMASAAVLRDAQLHGVALDDRPPASPPEVIRDIAEAYLGLIPRAAAARQARTSDQ